MGFFTGVHRLLVVVHGPSCFAVCGILALWPGIKPKSPAPQGRFSATGPPRKSPIPGSGRSSGEGKGYPLQCSGLEDSMDSIVLGVTKNQTQLSAFHFLYRLLLASLVAQMIPEIWRSGFDPWVWKIPWRRVWQPTPVFLPGESPWTEEPSYSPEGSPRVKHDWTTKHNIGY